MNAFDADGVSNEALSFRAGCLAVREAGSALVEPAADDRNREMQRNLNGRLPNVLPPPSSRLADDALLRELLVEDGFDGREAGFRAYFASVPRHFGKSRMA